MSVTADEKPALRRSWTQKETLRADSCMSQARTNICYPKLARYIICRYHVYLLTPDMCHTTHKYSIAHSCFPQIFIKLEDNIIIGFWGRIPGLGLHGACSLKKMRS